MFKTMLALFFLSSLPSANAASFSRLTAMTDSRLEAAAGLYAKEIKAGQLVLAECSSLLRLKVTKRPTEPNLNTMKQLAVMKGGLYHSDGETVGRVLGPTPGIVEELVMMSGNREFQDEDEETATRRFMASFSRLLTKAESVKTEMYRGIHSFEDGTWGLLLIYDTRKQEVLLLKAGYCGT